MFKILHTADLHFSTKSDKLQEVVRVTDDLLQYAACNPPDCIVVAGDLLDQYDGKIGADSDCFRAAKRFIHAAADIAPVVVIRGTKSHDKDISGLFDDIRCKHPVHVASEVEMVSLVRTALGELRFFNTGSMVLDGCTPLCAFTLVPSLDKAALMGMMPTDSIKAGNFRYRELVHDMFAGFGLINERLSCPTVLVTHGMLTGAEFSSGQMAIGEDLEFGLNDLRAAKCDAVMLGHVHKSQSWGEVSYSGSPGRLNFGETEDKGFLVWEFAEKHVRNYFVPTPARKFLFGDLPEWSGANNVYNEALCIARDSAGAHIRFRFSIPEEERAAVDLKVLRVALEKGGAAVVKIECQVVPRQRQRAAGISQACSLAEKVVRWGETVGQDIPSEVIALAGRIDGLEVDDLLDDGASGQDRESYSDTQDRDFYVPDGQFDLFADVA